MESEEGTAPPPDESTTTTVVVRRRFRWLRTILLAIIALAAFLAIGVIVLNSAIGHRFVVSRIANIAPASGLRIKIGRIDGSLYGAATLRDVTLSDPQGPFVRIPMVELDWRPTHWFSSGLDVRKLVTHQGTLLRVPHFRPGNPNAPTLPNFDIRIDRFQIDAMTVAAGVLGSRRRADFLAKVDIRKGRAYVRAQGGVSGGDLVYALLDTEPDRDKFDLHLDVNAPKGGLLASMSGIQQDLRIRAAGKGGWRRWDGGLLVDRSGTRLAALQVTNRKGLYSALGQAWPGGLLQGTAARAVGPVLAIGADGTLTNSVLKGSIGARGAAFRLLGGGVVDLANNAFHRVAATIDLTDPQLLGPSVRIDGARLTLLLDGKFRNFTAEQTVIAQRLASGSMRLERVAEHGVATYDGARWTLPVDLAAARAVSGNATVDPRLVDAHARGTFVLAGDRLTSDDLTVAVPGLGARLALRGDFAKGTYAVAGPVVARGWRLPNLGLVDADAKIVATFGAVPWKVSADLSGRMARVENATLTSLAGQNIRFAGAVSTGAAQPLLFQRARLVGTKLDLALSGRVLPDGRTTLAGSGRHADYGAFTIEATMAQDGPHAELVFADPYPAAQLSNVRVALAPIPDGFRIETAGGSMLGPFAGTLGLYMRPGGPTRVQIQHLVVSNTAVTGALVLGGSAVTGDLALSGGGVSGTVHLSPRGGGQAFAVALTADNARFGGATPLTIAAGRLDASGLLVGGHSTITGSLQGQGIGSGSLFIGRVAANASLQDGRGRILASLAGRRGSRFNLQLLGDVAPKRIAVLAQGDFAGRKIVMPRRAVLTEEAGGWRLAPTQIDFAGGRIIGQGLFGSRATELNLALADMPLSVADIVVSELGVGGRASGLISYRAPHGGIPTGDVRLMIRGLTRSGLVLTSRPIDLALVGQLGARELQMRAVASEGGQVRGRLQARVGGLPPGGTLIERLSAGSLFAQLRYDGPADALWRLAAIEAFDLTGPISVAADLTGSMANPQIRGSAASTALRLQSALTGTDLSQVSLRGNFAGSRLDIPTLTGRTPNGGTVVGSGTVNLSGIGTKGPQLDLKLAAHNAQILNRSDMAATVTGPIRIVSDGITGTVAGRLSIERATWRLGQAKGIEQLPNIRTREINRPADIAPPRAASAPWRYLIDAAGPNRINVTGLGMDSEWGADIRLRGTTDAPTLVGHADFVRGGYEFAGKRFDLTRGRITFDGSSPPDPRLDIAATATETGLTANVTVTGFASHPDIAFTSNPAMPEEDLLSRLLFGNSISQISAPEALQLGAALASLRGGGGLDPINKLRTAVGLDRLRIVPADPTTGQGTGIAAGKYLGRKFYAEIVTDGRGYSATQLEFRVSRWISILGSISTVGHQSLNAKISKDY